MPMIEVDRDRARAFIEQAGHAAAHQEAEAERQQEKIVEQLESADSNPDSWRTLTDKATNYIADKGCPAWEIKGDEREWWSGSLAECLDRYFPGALEGFDTWHPIAKLIGATSVIVAMRIDFENGGFQPLHHHTKGTEDNAEGEQGRRTLDIGDRGEPERQNHTGFKTDGE